MKISVVIHTFNSEKGLEKTLDSVRDFDEIIVCDMYSEDRTLEIAKQYNCKVILHERCGIVEPARNTAIQSADNEWVLVVDSDEVVTVDLRKLLYDIIQQENPSEAYGIPRKNFFMGKFMHAVYPDYQIRFFLKDKVYWPPFIHSRPEINGKTEMIPSDEKYAFLHLDDHRVSMIINKTNIYTDKEVLKKQDKNAGILSLLFKPFFRFFSYYIMKGGFRDGKAGFIYAGLSAFYKYAVIVKLLEKKNKTERI
ncbi:MAG: glycosyltransferase family 2 protein [Dysgonamonadaceae bacterium]|jgi:glycosyltransferase involved in cell wall biosynthesis|nr:glycosyltransferase family 2 protein [Dysgonamonadaceae bacterium]